MPIPKRKKGEKVTKYRSRIIGFLIGEGKSREQASAIAYTTTGTSRKTKKHKKKK